ncbi:MAG: PepSY domain-containing protein [Solibacillus sp.]
MKKRVIIPTVLAGVLGGVLLTQQATILGSAEKLELLSATEAKALALKEFSGEIVEFDFDRDHAPHYEFEIVNGKEKVELIVDAQSGAVLVTEREAMTKQVQTATNPIGNTVNKAVANVEKNVEAVENKVDAAVTNAQIKAETVVQQVTPTPKVEAAKQQAPKLVPAPTQQASIITKAQAIAIAQAKASGTVVDVDYDEDDFEYEIEIKNGTTEYDFEIDARTGAIIKFEKDIDDDQDD